MDVAETVTEGGLRSDDDREPRVEAAQRIVVVYSVDEKSFVEVADMTNRGHRDQLAGLDRRPSGPLVGLAADLLWSDETDPDAGGLCVLPSLEQALDEAVAHL